MLELVTFDMSFLFDRGTFSGIMLIVIALCLLGGLAGLAHLIKLFWEDVI